MCGRLIALALIVVFPLVAAPNQRRYEYDDFRAALADMQHEAGNNQHQIKVFEERLSNLDSTLDVMQRDVSILKSLQKEKVSASARDVDARIGALDLSTKSVIADLKTLRGQLNDSAASLAAQKNRITAIENILESQNRNIDALQAAVSSLADLMQVKDGPKPTAVYIVKNGDALEKIARQHQMTVAEIKELNGLEGTKIKIGQKLLVYDR